MNQPTDRYHYQTLLPFWGAKGQDRLGGASVLVAGCGGLGGHLATLLARAGVGRLVLADRDKPELSNLHRQVMFDEGDLASGRPKAELAAERLRRMNSEIAIKARVTEISDATIGPLLAGIDLVVDGMDNFAARLAINDAAARAKIPWVHGAAVGTVGAVMNIAPGGRPCLRCLYPQAPNEAAIPHTSREGIVGTLPALVAAMQATEALRILLAADPTFGVLWHLDPWRHSIEAMPVAASPACPACG
jgi:molybdopterin-synthase adenylyltransferase